MTIPVVPISEFKANPARFIESGAIVTNHGKPRAQFVPIDAESGARATRAADAAKATLRALYRVQRGADVMAELAELAASRDADMLGDAE